MVYLQNINYLPFIIYFSFLISETGTLSNCIHFRYSKSFWVFSSPFFAISSRIDLDILFSFDASVSSGLCHLF